MLNSLDRDLELTRTQRDTQKKGIQLTLSNPLISNLIILLSLKIKSIVSTRE